MIFGYHRTGLSALEKKEIEGIVRICINSDKMSFKGFLPHPGHTCDVKSMQEIPC